MTPYRIKHVPTGLYYKPGDINLSKTGKIYAGSTNRLTYMRGMHNEYISCRIRICGDAHQKLLRVEGIHWKEHKYDSVIVYIPKEQFVKEEI